jgi:hypothetical protein
MTWTLLYTLGGYNPPSFQINDLPSLDVCKIVAKQLMFQASNNQGFATMKSYMPYAKAVRTKTGEVWETTFMNRWAWERVTL